MTTEPVTPQTLHGWHICLRASEEARRRGDRRTGTEHILLALFEDPSIEAVLGVSLEQTRQALESLDHEALGSLGLDVGAGVDAPPLPMHPVPKKPRFRDLVNKDRLRLTPMAKRMLEQASKPNRRRGYVTTHQVLAQILALEPPDPAAVLLANLGVNTAEVLSCLDLSSDAAHETDSDAAVPLNDEASR